MFDTTARCSNTARGCVNGFKQPVLAQLPTLVFAPFITLAAVLFFLHYSIKLESATLLYISILSSTLAVLLSILLFRYTLNNNAPKTKATFTLNNWYRSLMPFTLMAFVGALNTELASVLLGWLINYESVAYFKVAMQTVALISLALTSMNMVIMPNIAQLYKSGNLDETQNLLTKSVRLSTLISLPIILILMVLGKFLIISLFGDEYLSSYPVLAILCIGQIVNVLMGSVGLVLNMTNNERTALKDLFLAMLLNVILLIFLVPTYGAIGAAISVSCSLIFWNIAMAVHIRKITMLKTWFTISNG